MIKEIFKGLLLNKTLTFLMFLGLFISTLSLSSIIIISNGVKNEIVKSLKTFGFGYDSILILAGPGKLFSHQKGKFNTLKMTDVLEIERIDGVKAVSPFNHNFGVNSSYKNNFLSIDVFGVHPQFSRLHEYPIRYGRFIDDADVRRKAKVCVIGNTVVKNLFKDSGKFAVGQFIKISDLYFQVIGVYQTKGSAGPFDIDKRVLTPLSVFNDILFHQDYLRGAKIVVENPDHITSNMADIGKILRKRHNIKDGHVDDFRLITSDDIIKFVNKSTDQLSKILFAIATISFFVSGLTILNIMLTSVFKRIKEIGVRRACGAKKIDILKQFLSESILVSITGAMSGVIVTSLLLWALHSKIKFKILISAEPFIVSLLFGILIGGFFGFFPAFKAAQVDPIRAIND